MLGGAHGGSTGHLRVSEQGLALSSAGSASKRSHQPQQLLPSPSVPGSVLTTGLPVRRGLHEEDVEGRRQVSGRLILFVSLVERHEQVLLHREGSLQASMRMRSN